MPRGGRPASAEIARRDLDRIVRLAVAALAVAALPGRASAMHIADGVLPAAQCVLWAVVCAPFVAASLRAYRRRTAADPFTKALVATAAALVFVLSSVEIPLPLGTSAHAYGVGLAAILLGPSLAVLAALAALVLEAFLLGHGGVTALGADLASMGIAGAFAGWTAFRVVRAAGGRVAPAAFVGALAANVATYALASLQLATALAPAGGFRGTYSTFLDLLAAAPRSGAGVEVVPGISSITAGAAARVPLADGDDALAVRPAARALRDLPRLAREFETLLLLKAGRHLADLAGALAALGLAERAWVVNDASRPDERVERVADVACARAGYFTTVLVRTRPDEAP